MNVKKIKDNKNILVFSIIMVTIAVILVLSTIGLGEYTTYLTNVCIASPDNSMKEFISGFGVLFVGLVTFISSLVTLIVLWYISFCYSNPDIFEDDK